MGKYYNPTRPSDIVNENEFVGQIAGRVRWVYNRRYCYFRANQLPFPIRVNVRLRRRFRSAAMSLCRLDGRLEQMTEREREIVVRMMTVKEAVYSTMIDSDSPSMDDLLRHGKEELGDDSRSVKDVENYIDALDFAFSDSSGSRKITSFTISELHKRLMDTEKGRMQDPGEFRVDQNFIGSKNDTLETARFVPTDPMSLPSLMENLMKYINTSSDDPLYKIALAHYQFEILHPMRDGNGRMGRLLTAAMMFSEGMMTYATVPFSEYLYEHRDDYHNKLFNISAKDDFDSWFLMFLDAITTQSDKAVRMMDNVLKMRGKMLSEETNEHRRAVIEALFDNPYITVSEVMGRTGLTRPGALKLMGSMEERGILKEISGRMRGRVYLSESVRSAY